MNLGGALHNYLHLCAAIGLWVTLASAPPSLTWLSALSLLLFIIHYLRGWKVSPIPVPPAWTLLISCAVWLWWSQLSLESLIGVTTILCLSRLVSARRSSEYTQLLLLTFTQVLFASTLEFEISFGLSLIAYMIAVTTALTLNHLYGEIERSVDLTGDDFDISIARRRLQRRLESGRLIDGRFLVGIGAVASLLCLSAIILFFIFPRVGGQWYQGYQLAPARSGFSGDVSLGAVGEIQLDDRVAFRAIVRHLSPHEPLEIAGLLPSLYATSDESDSQNKSIEPLQKDEKYWIGRALDHYERGRWRQTSSTMLELPQRATRWINRRSLSPHRSRFTLQHLYLDARGHSALFRLGQALAVSLPLTISAPPLKVSREGGLLYHWPGDLHYAVLSITDQGPLYEEDYKKERGGGELSQGDRKRYLQLPQSLREPLREYALKVIGDEKEPQKVANLLLEHFIKGEFRYDLSQKATEEKEDPILLFLTRTRAGHCEYFSSAMTLLLRSIGIPARQITGYAGGEWSELGAYYIVRNRDAHAWVEMWRERGSEITDQRAWLRLDPTPQQNDTSERASLLSKAKKWSDHMQFLWFRYVLGFDARDQLQAVKRTKKTVNESLKDLREAHVWSKLSRWWRHQNLWWPLSLLAILAIIASRIDWRRAWNKVFLWWYRRSLHASPEKGQDSKSISRWRYHASLEATHLYERALLGCEQLGVKVKASSSGVTLINELSTRDQLLSLHFQRVYDQYTLLRFSEGWGPESLDALREALALFERGVAEANVVNTER